MPFHGSADVGGKHREASADSTVLQRTFTDVGVPFDSDKLRITGLSRVTFNITQLGGVPGNFQIFFQIREDTAPILWGTVLIGAVGVPEVITIHLTGRKVFARLNFPTTTAIINIYATGQS